MALLSSEARLRFEETVGWSGATPEDFTLTETPAAEGQPGAHASTEGWITVFRISTRIARTYTCGSKQNWLLSFRKDLAAKIFDFR